MKNPIHVHRSNLANHFMKLCPTRALCNSSGTNCRPMFGPCMPSNSKRSQGFCSSSGPDNRPLLGLCHSTRINYKSQKLYTARLRQIVGRLGGVLLSRCAACHSYTSEALAFNSKRFRYGSAAWSKPWH